MRIIDTFKIGVLKEDSFLSKKECKDVITKIDNYKFISHHALQGTSKTTFNTGKNQISDYLSPLQVTRLLEKTNQYCKLIGHPNVSISNAWVNVQNKNTVLKKHAHPLSVVSGALFLEVDKNSSGLYFSNPFKNHYQPIESSTEYSFDTYRINPVLGTLVIFPSWLEHSSNEIPNSSNRRIVLSFNTYKI